MTCLSEVCNTTINVDITVVTTVDKIVIVVVIISVTQSAVVTASSQHDQSHLLHQTQQHNHHEIFNITVEATVNVSGEAVHRRRDAGTTSPTNNVLRLPHLPK